MSHRGFTLLELLIVIAIIGILASIVLVSVEQSRRQSINRAIVDQVLEYRKALELAYSNNGAYPFFPPWANLNNRVICLGDDVGTLDCLASTSYGTSGTIQTTWNDNIHNVLRAFMSTLPHMAITGSITVSSPGYHRCVSVGPNYYWSSPNNVCGASYYSLWYVLAGTNQDCGPGIVVDPNFTNDDPLTLCRLQSQ